MADLVLPGAQYVLSLDSLDMVYINRYLEKPFERKHLLWTIPDLDGESKYCRVKIVSKQFQDPSQNCICHICNARVPIIYIKLHNKSIKHQTLEKLTETILENYSKQTETIIYDVDDDDHHSESDTYYCDICCQAVLKKQKSSHNKTSKHIKSKKHEKLLTEFIKMYTDNRDEFEDPDDDKTLTDGHSDAESDVDSINDVSSTVFDSDEDTDTFTNHGNESGIATFPNSIDRKTKTVSDRVKILNNAKYCSPEEIKDFEMYLQQILVKYYIYNDMNFNLIVNEDSIDIITANGRRNKITVDIFHSYTRVENSVFCQICQLWINDETKVHSVTDLHIRLVTQPIDEHFARRINDEWNHCLICNERIYPNSDHATLNSYHRSQLNTSTRYGITIDNDDKDKQSFCYICGLNIPKPIFIYHINSKEHKEKWLTNYEKNSDMKFVDISRKTENSKFKFNGVCSKIEHACGKLNFESVNSPNPELKIDCSKYENKAMVSNDKNSDGKFYSYCKQFRYFDKTHVLCYICKTVIGSEKDDIIQHVENKMHSITVANLLKNNKITMPFEAQLYYCRYCDDITLCFLDHIKQPEHVDLVQINKIIDINVLWKVVCENNGWECNNTSYKVMYKHLLVRNFINPKGNIYYCHICEVDLTRFDIALHILSNCHTDRIRLGCD